MIHFVKYAVFYFICFICTFFARFKTFVSCISFIVLTFCKTIPACAYGKPP